MSPKERLRGEMRERLGNVSREEFLSQGLTAAALLIKSPFWLVHRSIFLFLSIDNSEINTRPLLEAALKEGKNVFAPGIDAGGLAFYPIYSSEGPWRRGPFGILEPERPNAAGFHEDGDSPALIIAPGLAFDPWGNRLGRGKGYYDRFFATLDAEARDYTAIGLCMDFQVVSGVPTGENDKKMDAILTGSLLMPVGPNYAGPPV